MTAPGEVDDPRIQIPIQTMPYEAKMDASVPMATDPQVGDVVALVPTDDSTMELGAAPMRVPEVGETVVILPWKNPLGGIRYIGIPTATAIPAPPPTTWETVAVRVGAPLAVEAITATSVVIATGGGFNPSYMHRSDDSGATWTPLGVCTVDDETGNTIVVYDVCANAAKDGGYIISGRLYQSPYTRGIWRHNPETGNYIQTYTIPVLASRGHLFRIPGGYYLGCVDYDVGYFSADGDTWAARGAVPHSQGPYRPGIVSGSIIVQGTSGIGAIHRSTDGGASWGTVYLPGGSTGYGFFGAWNDGTVIGRGGTGSGALVRSTDRGATWAPIDPQPTWPSTIHVPRGAGYVVAIDSTGSVNNPAKWARVSTDYGTTWTPITSQPSFVWDMMTSPGQPWVVLPSGIVIVPLYRTGTSTLYVWRGLP